MDEHKPKRRWWRMKRAWAVGLLLWLVVGYPAVMGPLTYASWRGWVSTQTCLAAYRPVSWEFQLMPRSLRDVAISVYRDYTDWWGGLAGAPPTPGSSRDRAARAAKPPEP